MLAAMMMVILKAMVRMTLKERVRVMNRELDSARVLRWLTIFLLMIHG